MGQPWSAFDERPFNKQCILVRVDSKYANLSYSRPHPLRLKKRGTGHDIDDVVYYSSIRLVRS